MSEAEWKSENAENKTSQVESPEILPLLPIRDIVIYPYMMLPLFVGRDGCRHDSGPVTETRHGDVERGILRIDDLDRRLVLEGR